MTAARVATVGALVAGAVLAFLVLTGGGDGHSYRVIFETGGQLVPGNQVLVGGQEVGTVDDIALTDDGQAQVDITTEEPLHEGTTAVIRATSLSGIANRYVSVDPGPDSAPELADDAVLTSEQTTTPVDLDQLFNTLDAKTRRSLQKVFAGSAELYAGNTEAARKTYKYFGPALQSSQRLLAELNRDQRVLSEFLVSGSRVVGAVAERRDDLSALTANANEALGAIAAENAALDRSLVALPPAMRQANTTFVNLRAALDDLDPLVEASKPATRDLAPFLRDLRPVASRAVPVVSDLRRLVARDGGRNDLTDILREAPAVKRAAGEARPDVLAGLEETQDEVAALRAYAPELFGTLTTLGQVTSYYDADGHYARVLPAASGVFSYESATDALLPAYLPPLDDDVFDFFRDSNPALETYSGTGEAWDPSGFQRCPGGASQNAEDGSTPFLSGGELTGACEPGDMVIPVTAP